MHGVLETRRGTNRCVAHTIVSLCIPLSGCKIERCRFPGVSLRPHINATNADSHRRQTICTYSIPASPRSPALFQASSGDKDVEAIANLSSPTAGVSTSKAASPAGRIEAKATSQNATPLVEILYHGASDDDLLDQRQYWVISIASSKPRSEEIA